MLPSEPFWAVSNGCLPCWRCVSCRRALFSTSFRSLPCPAYPKRWREMCCWLVVSLACGWCPVYVPPLEKDGFPLDLPRGSPMSAASVLVTLSLVPCSTPFWIPCIRDLPCGLWPLLCTPVEPPWSGERQVVSQVPLETDPVAKGRQDGVGRGRTAAEAMARRGERAPRLLARGGVAKHVGRRRTRRRGRERATAETPRNAGQDLSFRLGRIPRVRVRMHRTKGERDGGCTHLGG